MNTKQMLRRNRMKTGKPYITGESATLDGASETLFGENVVVLGESENVEGNSETRGRGVANIDNEAPEKIHLRQPRPVGRIKRWLTRSHKFWRPDPTPAEQELIEQQQRNMRIRRAMFAQMMIANKIIPEAYANLGYEYYRQNKSKHESAKPSRVSFGKWLYSADGNTIYGKIRRIPYGINPAILVDDNVLTALSVSVGHPVGGRLGDNGEGVHIYISLAGRNDFPNEIRFRDMLPKVPTGARPLTFILGATQNAGREWRSLEDLPHFLVAGETGGGKTNFMHTMICTFIIRNRPEEVRLAMIDLKFGGVALNRYEGIPHMISVPGVYDNDGKTICQEVKSGIANDIPSAISVLRWALEESQRRGELFLTDQKHHPQKIEEWNKFHRKHRLPSVCIFVDELALLMDKSDMDRKEDVEQVKLARYYIKTILRLARSSGIHLCGFTQSLDKSVMGVAFKTNVSGRLCFSVADSVSSILVVGDGAAVNLQPAGRGVYKRGTDKFMVQTPLIVESDIAECIRNAKTGKLSAEFTSKAVMPEDLIRWSISEGNYSLNQSKVIEHFKGQIAINDLVSNLLPSMDGNEYEIDGERYRVIPGGSHLSRRVERI